MKDGFPPLLPLPQGEGRGEGGPSLGGTNNGKTELPGNAGQGVWGGNGRYAFRAGGDAPSAAAIDGRSFLPLLDGVGPAPRTWVFSEFDSNYFVRDDRWKLDSEGRLFDLQAPPEIAERVEAPLTPDSARAREKLSQVLVELGLVAP